MPPTTITFSEAVGDGPGMQKLGHMAPEGLTYGELVRAKWHFEAAGRRCELVDLIGAAGVEELGGEAGPEEAYLLIVRGGAAALGAGGAAALVAEQRGLVPDKSRLAPRWALTFGDAAQEPDCEAGRGRVVPFAAVPALATARAALPAFFGPRAAGLLAEGTYYHYAPSCGFGFRGDSGRRVVIALHLDAAMTTHYQGFLGSAAMPLHYQWFLRGRPEGRRVALELGDGDLYAMSGKAAGTDWRSSSFPTLRHAAGAAKYLHIG